MTKCGKCDQDRISVISAVVDGVYYSKICRPCLNGYSDEISDQAASHERNRQYEDHAQDTVQPYTAAGPNSEFLRLYPDTARKVFSPDVIEQLKRKL